MFFIEQLSGCEMPLEVQLTPPLSIYWFAHKLRMLLG